MNSTHSRLCLLGALLLAALVVYAADFSGTTKPLVEDPVLTLQQKAVRSAYDLQQALVGFGTNSMRAAVTLSSTNLGATILGTPAVNLNSNTNQVAIAGVPTINLNSDTNQVRIAGTAAVSGNLGGFTLVTNLALNVDTTAAGVAANDALAPMVTLSHAVRTDNGSGILQSISLITGDNNTNAVRLLICGAPITWPATNAAANLVMSELATNLQGMVEFINTDYKAIGTNYLSTKAGLGIGIRPATNTLFLYAVCAGLITNANPCRLVITILQD